MPFCATITPGTCSPLIITVSPIRCWAYAMLAEPTSAAPRSEARRSLLNITPPPTRFFQDLLRVWLSCWTNLPESDRTSCGNIASWQEVAMPKMEIEVPEQLAVVGKAIVEH